MAGNLLALLGPRLKPAMFPYWLLSRGVTLGVRCVAFDKAGLICLVKHTYTPGWHLPGGGVEPGETALQAIEKELAEEAGITLRAPPELFGVYANQVASRRDHVLVYTARDWHQTIPLLPTREIAEVGMYDPASLPPDTSRGTAKRIREVVEDCPPTPVW